MGIGSLVMQEGLEGLERGDVPALYGIDAAWAKASNRRGGARQM